MTIENYINELTNEISAKNPSSSLLRTCLLNIISDYSESDLAYVSNVARRITDNNFGKNVYIRGLVEFTNYCKNDCFYCGIRCSNNLVERYRLTESDILECCKNGHELGFKTFVLQGGEDLSYKDSFYTKLISTLKNLYPECAVTLSIGEKDFESYKAYKDAGLDRYLLRHETATKSHYEVLHPSKMSFEHRIQCLKNLKSLNIQTGCGIMVGSPYQTKEHLVNDLLFMFDFKPEMVGIGPFIPCSNTPFAKSNAGSVEDTLMMIALTRILLPNALIPATTALGSANSKGRIRGLDSGCNVIMINISPKVDRSKYNLYDNKSITASDDMESLLQIKNELETNGYIFNLSRGDYKR